MFFSFLYTVSSCSCRVSELALLTDAFPDYPKDHSVSISFPYVFPFIALTQSIILFFICFLSFYLPIITLEHKFFEYSGPNCHVNLLLEKVQYIF